MTAYITTAGFPWQICTKVKCSFQNGNKSQLWNDCISTKCSKKMLTCRALSHSKEAWQWMFKTLAAVFALQQLRLQPLLLNEGDAGVLWEVCWKGEPLTCGGGHVRGVSERSYWVISHKNSESKTSEWPAPLLTSLRDATWPVVSPATSSPREPVPTEKCTV